MNQLDSMKVFQLVSEGAEEIRQGVDAWYRFVEGAGRAEGGGDDQQETREAIELYYPLMKHLLAVYELPNEDAKIMVMAAVRAVDACCQTYGEHLSLATAMAYAELENDEEVREYLDEEFPVA